MTAIDAYHLPGLREGDVARWNIREYGGGEVRLRVPVLEPPVLEAVVERLRVARANYLEARPVGDVVRAIDLAARRLADRGDPRRELAERALPAVTGYSPPMVRLVLDRMAADWTEPALASLLRSEFGDPAVLDTFRPRPGGNGRDRVRAFGPALAFHVFAGNVPGVAVTSLVRSLLVKAATLGKTASGDPLLPALFARTLAEVDPELGECIAVTYWPGGSAELEEIALRAAETVVVYGGEEAVAGVRARTPAGTRLVVHGPRISLVALARESLAADRAPRVAEEVARAAAIFDQQGCVSPHLVYAERGGDIPPEDFAGLLAKAMEGVERELPRGRISAAEAAAIQQLRGAAEWRALGGRDVRLLASEGTEYTVLYEADPAFAASCLNRVVRVKPIDSLDAIVQELAPYAAFLQTVGVDAPMARRLDLAERLGRVGVSRVTTLERMPWPPPDWHHDGQEPLRELVRWVDLEG